MESVLSFIIENWRVLVDICALILSVVICLVKKRPCVNQVDTIKEYILEILPTLIDYVESPGVSGEQKKSKVIDVVSKSILKKYGVSAATFFDFISESIENILKTPQKKGN